MLEVHRCDDARGLRLRGPVKPLIIIPAAGPSGLDGLKGGLGFFQPAVDLRRFDDGQTRYESAVGRHHHDHLICKRCQTIIEFEDDRIEALQQAVAKLHGFLVTHHKLELYGLCADCQASGATAEPEHFHDHDDE